MLSAMYPSVVVAIGFLAAVIAVVIWALFFAGDVYIDRTSIGLIGAGVIAAVVRLWVAFARKKGEPNA